VTIPPRYSFLDLTNAKVEERDLHYLKVINVDLKPGDCAYIPAHWWFQLKALSVKPAPGDKVGPKLLSTSVQYWYEVHSYWVKNIFHGLDNQLYK